MRLLITIAVLYFAIKWIVMPFFQGLMASEEKDQIQPESSKNRKDGEYVDYEEVD